MAFDEAERKVKVKSDAVDILARRHADAVAADERKRIKKGEEDALAGLVDYVESLKALFSTSKRLDEIGRGLGGRSPIVTQITGNMKPQMPALLLYQYIEFLKEPPRKHGVEIENPIPRPDSDGKHVF